MPIRCERVRRGGRARIPEVGDVWLDAGIVPFSTLGWQNPEWIERGLRDGRRRGLTTADLPDHAYWEQWFPADWVSEMREQIRLWFYSQLFMSVVAHRAARRSGACSATRRCSTRTGREMHGSWGNMIDAEEAFARMGADVMRWQYCAQPPDQNLLFGFGPARGDQAQAAHALELGLVLRPVREHRGLPADVRRPRARAGRASCGRSTAGSRAHATQLVAEATEALRGVPHLPA